MRQIRRYANRKLYDVEGGRYVTLEDLADAVGKGEDVLVQDRSTGEDLTNLTLAQMLLDAVRGGAARIPRPVLVRLVRLSRGPAAGWGEWISPHDAASRTRTEVERLVGGLLARGRLSLEEGLALRQDLARSVHRIVAEAQTGTVARVKSLFDHPPRKSPLAALKGRLEAFDTSLGRPGSAPRGMSRRRNPRARKQSTR